jgi:hypothetical protein
MKTKQEMQEEKYNMDRWYYSLVTDLQECMIQTKGIFFSLATELTETYSQIEKEILVDGRDLTDEDLQKMEECIDGLQMIVSHLREREV